LNPPEKFKKKTLCFLKLSECELSPETVDASVIYGDFGEGASRAFPKSRRLFTAPL
jgi:hypothetical protein